MTSDPQTDASPRLWRRVLARRAVRYVAGLLALGLLVLVLLPYGIGYGLERWLVAHGAGQADVQDVDFNPFSGRLVLRGLEVSRGGSRVLHVAEAALNLAWAPLLQKQAMLERVALRDTTLTLERTPQGTWRVGGLKGAAAAPETPENGWAFGAQRLEISNSRIRYVTPELHGSMSVSRLELTGLDSRAPRQAVEVRLRGTLNKAGVQAQAKVYPFLDEPRLKGRLRLDGLALASFAEAFAARLQGLAGELHVDSELEIAQEPAGGFRLQQNGMLRLSEFAGRLPGARLTGARAVWDGELALWGGGETAPSLRSEGRLQSAGLSVEALDSGWRIRHDQARWEGRLGYGKADPIAAPQTAGALRVEGLRVEREGLRETPFMAEALVIQGLTMEPGRGLRAEQARGEAVRILREAGGSAEAGNENALLAAESLTIRELNRASDGGLAAGSVEIRGGDGLLRRTEAGRWQLLDALRSLAGESRQAGHGSGGRGAVRIDALRVTGASRLRLEDRTVKPVFRTTVHIQEARMDDLNSTAPGQPSPVSLEARIGEYTRVQLEGQIRPFADGPAMALNGRIDTLDLPPLSAYASRELGYQLKSGHLDAKLDLDVQEGRLGGDVDVVLNNLEITPKDPEKMQKMTSQLGMPLDAALAMLRDKQNDIRLNVPVQGDVADPKFDFGDAVNQAVGKAMRVAALSYLKYTFQPFGALITIGQLVGEATANPRLGPVIFEPGRASLGHMDEQYLARVAQMMQERPKLRLRLCGQAAAADRAALRIPQGSAPGGAADTEEALQALAAARAGAIKEHLVKMHGTSGERLFVCHAMLDPDPDARPRVELLLSGG